MAATKVTITVRESFNSLIGYIIANKSNEDLLDGGHIFEEEECPIESALRELFYMFERPGEKTIHIMYIGKVMTLLGMNPTELDIKRVITAIKKDEFGMVDYKDYNEYMGKLLAKPDDPDFLREETKLLAAFQTLDTQKTGYIDTVYLKEVLRLRGEMLSDTEFDDLLALTKTDNQGMVNYRELVKLWCQKTSNHG